MPNLATAGCPIPFGWTIDGLDGMHWHEPCIATERHAPALVPRVMPEMTRLGVIHVEGPRHEAARVEEGQFSMAEDAVVDAEGQMHWEFAKLFWDGAQANDRRQLWFSHRDPVDFGPDDYDDVLWQLGESGFEPVGYQAFGRPNDDGRGGAGPAAGGVREVTLFKRPLGTGAPPAHH